MCVCKYVKVLGKMYAKSLLRHLMYSIFVCLRCTVCMYDFPADRRLTTCVLESGLAWQANRPVCSALRRGLCVAGKSGSDVYRKS